MKKYLALSIMLTLTLTACNSKDTASTTKEKTTTTQVEKNEKEAVNKPKGDSQKDKEETEKKVYTDGPLTEVGQQTFDDGVGTITLDKIERVFKHYETAGLIIKVKDAKILTVTDIDPLYKENVESTGVNHIIGKEFTYLQVDYDLENTTDKNVIFNGLDKAVLDNGKQMDLMSVDLLGMNNPTSSELLPKASVENNIIGIPVDKNIRSIRLAPSPVLYDGPDYDVFHPKEIRIEFK